MPYTIVTGIDGSDPSKNALRWSLWHAGLADGEVIAVQAWHLHSMYGLEEIARQLRDDATKTLEATISTVTDYPDNVERRCLEGHPAEVLLAQSQQAQLLVLGNRGHGGFVEALLGSVSQHCVHHAPCPVVIVRGTPTRQRPPRSRSLE